MALIAPQAVAATGTSPTFTTPTASDTIRPQDRGVLWVRSTGTTTTVTVTIAGNDDLGQARPDPAIALAATDLKAINMTAYAKYADPTTGLLTVGFSGALTGVTAAYVTV